MTTTDPAAVLALAAAVEAADGQDPLNEDARLQLARPDADAVHVGVHEDGRLVGYAQWQPANRTGQLLVHPDARRRGHGRHLLAQLPEARVWAFGNAPAAQGFAAASGLSGVRGLHRMGRPLPEAEPRPAPAGVVIRPLQDGDADDFLALNAAAFVDHPEQGHFSAADLAARRAEAWFDPAGFLVAQDADGLVGFHWTKLHPDALGEVYVLGVHPRAAGRGLGGVLLDAGLAHLRERGCTHVVLYVDADNTAAVRLYERAGFVIEHTDVLYG